MDFTRFARVLCVPLAILAACSDSGDSADTSSGPDADTAFDTSGDGGGDPTADADATADLGEDGPAGDVAADTQTDASTDAPPEIANVRLALGNCDGAGRRPPAYPNQLARGDELHKATLDDPDALCNDGTPAVLYVRAATDEAHAGDWMIHLQGGGACMSYEECAARWCGTDYYDASKMSSDFTPETIRGNGIHTSDARSQFAAWNHVFFYYCSSDTWSGVSSGTLGSADETSAFSLYLRGHSIVEAGFEALDAGLTSDDGEEILLPLTQATRVVWSGTSAGSGGAQRNADWVAARFDAEQTEVVAIFDASVGPLGETLPEDVAAVTGPQLGAGMARVAALHDEQPFMDESCVAAHAGNPYVCLDGSLVRLNHITTPYFARMDLTDSNNIDSYLQAGATRQEYAQAVADTLALHAEIDETAVEADSIERAPGLYGPNCGQHVGIESVPWTFAATVESDGVDYTFQDAFLAWLEGADVFVVDDPAGTHSVCQPIDADR